VHESYASDVGEGRPHRDQEVAHRVEGAAVLRGMSVALLGALLGGGLGFLFLVLMARMLGQSDFGLLVLAVNLLITVATLSIVGADFALIYYVASASDPGQKRGAILTPIKLVIALNLTFALLVALLADPIANQILGEPRFTNILRVLAIALPVVALSQMFSAALSGLEHARGELARKVVEQSTRLVLAPIAVVLGLGVVGVAFGMVAAAAASAASVAVLLIRALPRGGRTVGLSTRAVLGFSWPQAVANMARQGWVLANLVILAHFTNAATVALFGAAFAISRLPLLVYNAFAFRFSPTIARLWAAGSRETLSQTLQSITRWVAIFAVPLFGLAIAAPGPLLAVYGSNYREAAWALIILTVAALLNALAGPVERALIMSGHVRLEMASNVIAASILIGLALVLTPRYGLTGAAVSALIYTVILNVLKSYFVWRTLRMHTFSLSLLGPLAAGFVAALLVALLARLTALGDSLPGVVALGLVLAGTYLFVLVRVIGISSVDRDTLGLALHVRRSNLAGSAGSSAS
jgi:O-antigen/teichoic acid export membrane protein